MTNEMRQELLAYLAEAYPNAVGVLMKPTDLIFEEAVKQNCYYCGRYGQNWRCPPNLPNVDYPKMMGEFDCGLFVYIPYTYSSQAEFDAARTESRVPVTRQNNKPQISVSRSSSPLTAARTRRCLLPNNLIRYPPISPGRQPRWAWSTS